MGGRGRDQVPISFHVMLLFILGASFGWFPGERSVLFSGSVIKVNRRGKTQERWLMITGQSLLNESSPKAVVCENYTYLPAAMLW